MEMGMSVADGFLRAIIAEPDEDAHRLAFADWLDENDQADRAEFIRAQCELARLPDDDPRRADLEVCERRLLAQHAVEWAAPWPAFGNWEYAGDGPWRVVFRRGFLEAIDLNGVFAPATEWGEVFARLCAAHPIRDLRFAGVGPGYLALLNAREELHQVESLEVWHWFNEREAAGQQRQMLVDLDALLHSPHLVRLRRLILAAGNPTGQQAAGWLRLPALAALEAVRDPSAHPADGRFLRALARGDLPQLRELSLQGADLPAFSRAADALVRSDLWPRLTALTVSNPMHFPWPAALANGRLRRLSVHGLHRVAYPPLAEALASWTGSPTLEELHLLGGVWHGGALGEALSSEALAGLRRLTIQHAELSDDDLEQLAGSPVLRRLNRLDVWLHRETGDHGLTALFGSLHLARLTHLRVVGGRITAAAIEALAGNGACHRLRVLHLYTPVSEAALTALTRGEPFRELHTVGLSWWRPAPNPAVVAAFLDSPKLPRLCVVPFSVYSREVAGLARVFQRCERIAWAGGEMIDGGDGMRVAVRPETVYLPNHLDDVAD
jgi:uncharacterized protein (TIGR02996 family)